MKMHVLRMILVGIHNNNRLHLHIQILYQSLFDLMIYNLTLQQNYFQFQFQVFLDILLFFLHDLH